MQANKFKWDGADFTSELKPYFNSIGVFHQLPFNRISAALYLRSPLFGAVFLEKVDALAQSPLETYNVRLGGVDGIQAGYLFRSPLRLKCDPYYALFVRRGCRPVQDIIKHPTSAEKRFVFTDNIVFHAHDSGYLLTRVEENGVTRMLGA